MGKSSGTNSTVTQTTAPNPQFQAAYQGAVNNAQTLAAQPYQQYQGSLLAPLQPYQNAAIGEIAGSQGIEQPLLNAAATDFSNASTPITATPFSASAVNQYLSPYTQDVTSSLQNLFNQQNATQQSQVTGNAAAEGAFGGDRSAVAAALTAGQQQAQEAPVLAQNLQTGYNTALGEFNAQQQANLQAQQATGWLEQGAGYGNANLGQEAQNTYLTGANALLNAGGLQQQQAQEGLNIPYEQFIAQESYPYQMAGWEANIAEGLGGASGGTSSTQYPGPSALSQAAGLGLAGTGLLNATGAFGNSGYLTGDTGLLSGILGTGAGIGAPLEAGAEGAFGGADIGSLLGDAAGAALVRRGGRIPRQGGGGLTTPYNTGLQLPGMANPTTGAPQLPNLATGYLPSAPPAPSTHTMPTGAGIGGAGIQNQQQPIQQALQTLQQLKSIKGLFPGDSSSTPAASMGGAVTLATPYQGFDDGGAPVLQAGQAATGGASPLSQGMIQQYLQLPMEQLQELAMRAPPQTPQGQAIQRALQMKKMNPGSAIGGAGAPTPPMSPQGMGVTPAPVGPATSALSPTLAAAWKGGRIGRDSGGDIPGLAVSPDSPLLTSPLSGTGEPSLSSPDLGVPGVSLATGPNANVVTQEGNAPPQQKPVTSSQPSGGGLAAPPPSSSVLPPVLKPIAQRESHGDYSAQNPTSSASGVLQDVDATWREAEHGLGYGDQWAHAKDAPPEVQNAANIWLHGRYGDKPWAASEPGHASNGKQQQQPPSLATGPSGSPGSTAFMGQVTDTGSSNTTNDANIQAALALLGRDQQTPQGGFYNSPWMPLVAAGAGMLASRSPFPGVALGEGLETGLKELGGQQAAIPENQLKQAQAAVAQVPLLKLQTAQGTINALEGNQGAGVSAAPVPSAGGSAAPSATGIGGPVVGGQAALGQPSAGGQTTASPLTAEQQAAVNDIRGRIEQSRVLRDQAVAWGDQGTANSAQAEMNRLTSQLPDFQAAQKTATGYAEVGPHVATTAADYPYKLGEAMGNQAGRAVSVPPGGSVVTGSMVMPEWQRQMMMGPAGGGSAAAVPGTGGGASVGTPALPTSSPGSGLPQAGGMAPPARPETPPFTHPGNLPPDQSMTSPETRMIPLPGGGVTTAATLPGIHQFHEGVGDLAKKTEESIPELTQQETALSAQHQEIVEAAANNNFYAPGATNPLRQHIGTIVNTAAQLLGKPEEMIDEKDLANSQAIDKAAFNLSTGAVHGISARPAQIEWQAARNAVPSNAQSAFPALLLSNSLRLINQYQQGQAQFVLQQYKNGVDPANAAASYRQTNGDRIAGSALAATYLDMAKARPDDKTSQMINVLLNTPPEHQKEVTQYFDQNFTPLSERQRQAFGVPSFGALMLQLSGR